MKQGIGDLLSLSKTGDDAWTTYGRIRCVVMNAALTGYRLDYVAFMMYSPKDTALARIREEAVLAVDEDASGIKMSEWDKLYAEMPDSKSLSGTALTLRMDGCLHQQTWTPYFPPAGSGPGGVDLPPTEVLRTPTSHAPIQLMLTDKFAFASSDNMADAGRVFEYTGDLIIIAHRTTMGQAGIRGQLHLGACAEREIEAATTARQEIVGKGWCAVNDFISSAHWRATPRGAVRGIVDHGAPVKLVSTASKEVLRPHEVKPILGEAANIVAVLQHIADVAGEHALRDEVTMVIGASMRLRVGGGSGRMGGGDGRGRSGKGPIATHPKRRHYPDIFFTSYLDPLYQDERYHEYLEMIEYAEYPEYTWEAGR